MCNDLKDIYGDNLVGQEVDPTFTQQSLNPRTPGRTLRSGVTSRNKDTVGR